MPIQFVIFIFTVERFERSKFALNIDTLTKNVTRDCELLNFGGASQAPYSIESKRYYGQCCQT